MGEEVGCHRVELCFGLTLSSTVEPELESVVLIRGAVEYWWSPEIEQRLETRKRERRENGNSNDPRSADVLFDRGEN